MGILNVLDHWNAHLSLDLADSVARAGGSLRGVVTLRVDKQLPFRSLRLEVTGTEEVCEYVESTYYGGVPGGYLKEKKHLVFDELVTLAGHTKHSQAEGKVEAEVGSYSYPFEVLLPHSLPPTHQAYKRRLWGHSAEVKYEAKVVLDMPMTPNAHDAKPFTVVVDTPASQMQAGKHEATGDHDFALVDRDNKESGKLSSRVTLDRTWLSPGSAEHGAVAVRCEIDNTQGVDPVQSVVLGLTLDPHLRIDDFDAKETVELVHEVYAVGVARGAKETHEFTLRVPADVWCSYPGLSAALSHHLMVGYDVPHCAKPYHRFPLTLVQAVVPDREGLPERRWREPSPFHVVRPGLEYAWQVPRRPLVEPKPLGAGVREADVPAMPWKGSQDGLAALDA